MTGLPSRVWPVLDHCRAHGFYLDPALIPPDDAVQDELCRVRGELDSLAAQPFTLDKDTS